jgi:hypothetical protein
MRTRARRAIGRRTDAGSARWVGLVVVSPFLVLVVVAALIFRPAQAMGGELAETQEPLGPTAAQTKDFLESGRAGSLVEEPETDLYAAQILPHRELGRAEALGLAEAVFEPELETTGRLLGGLEPEKYLSNYAVVGPVFSLSEASGRRPKASPQKIRTSLCWWNQCSPYARKTTPEKSNPST